MLARPRLRRTDWLVLGLVVVVQAIAPRTGSEMRGEDPAWVGAAALLTALGQAGALLWRRDAPLRSTVGVLILYAVSVVTVGAVPPVAPWVAIWALATKLSGRRAATRAAGLAAATTVGLLLVTEVVRAGAGASGFLSGVTVVVCLSAVLVRSERGRLDAVREASTAEERMRIAREMHDSVGHGLSAVAMQSSAARMALASDDKPTALRALAAVESTSRTALREMRQLLGVLASEHGTTDSGAEKTPGLTALAELVENVEAGGVAVTRLIDIDPVTVSPTIQLCAYRICQEALTNALKHSPGGTIHLSVSADHDQHGAPGLRLSVRTEGGDYSDFFESGVDPDSMGLGIPGIRDRAAAVGGTVSAAATDDGWLVEALLPLSVEERR
jgi:signal transduction histidine kinase